MTKRKRVEPVDRDGARLTNEVLTQYYGGKLTQAQIAGRLGVSAPKVNRLLRQARKQGLIEVTIRTPFQHLFDLEARLRAVYDIKEVLVIPAVPEGVNDMLYTLGWTTANYLLDHLHDGDIIGIGGGTAVHATVQALKPTRTYDVKVVPILGAVQGQVTTDVNYLATELAQRLGGKAYQVHAPAFVETREERDAIMDLRPVKEILDIARRANIALLGVGTVDYEASRFVQFTALSEEDMKYIEKTCKGVGEVGAYVYDVEGNPVAHEYAERVVGITLAELRRIPLRIAAAATTAKALPLYGALRGGYLHALITDEPAARGVLNLFERDFRKAS